MKAAETQLRNTLKANATFSLISGLSLLIFTEYIALQMNVNTNLPFIIIGIGLLFFVVLLGYNAYREKISLAQVRIIIIQDGIWVLGSIILIIMDPFSISFIGNIIIAIVAMIVLILAILQSRSLRKLKMS